MLLLKMNKFLLLYNGQGSEYITVSKYVKVLDILGYIRGSLRKRCVIYA